MLKYWQHIIRKVALDIVAIHAIQLEIMHNAIHNIMTSHYSTRNTDEIQQNTTSSHQPSLNGINFILIWIKKSSFKFVKPANSAKNF